MLTYTYDFDIVPGAAPLVVHLKQYETGTILNFNLLPRVGDLSISALYTDCKVRGTKKDGNGYSANATVTGTLMDCIQVTVDEQMTAVAGKQPFELTVTDSSGKMITATFILDVQKAALDGTTITSESVIEEIGEFLVNNPSYIDRSVDNLGEYVAEWLDDHPEATTTVPDHSISEVKLDTALTTKISSDATLLQSGRPADAYATGQRLAEISSEIGVLANLNTSNKSNLVSAINEAMVGGGGVASVMDYGAKGDGTTDDSGAIQDALDDLLGGGVIFFPKATYLIKSAVLFYSNQTLWFENGAVLKQGAEINNLLRTYSQNSWTGYNGVHDSVIYGAIFDGGTYTTNNTLVGMSHAKNITIENCTFRNAYGGWHDLEINSSYNVKVSNCEFEGTRRNATSAEMIQIDCAIESSMYPWSNVNYDGTVTKYVDISRCIFHSNSQSPAVGNHYTSASATNNNIRIHDCVFDNLTSSRGAINFESHTTDIDIYDNTFYFNAGASNRIGIGASYSSHFIHGNRFVNAATAVSGSGISHFNMINGTYTA